MQKETHGCVTLKRTTWEHLALTAVLYTLSQFLSSVGTATEVQPDRHLTTIASAEASCTALARGDFSDITDAPTRVVASRPVSATESVPAHCEVSGYIVPSIGIKLGLPFAWNGKFIEIGCGGSCGLLDEQYPECGELLRAGFACIVSDMGHNKGIAVDYLWSYHNLQAKVDFGIRATHLAALAGKGIAERYYVRAPNRSYFMGCSTGGGQGLHEAQSFPWDFDGIVAGAPPVRLADVFMTWVWAGRALHAPDGKTILGRAELKLLNDAAVARCDKEDGVADHVIGSPFTCHFDPSSLLCAQGQNERCLSASQIEATKLIYAGPTNSQGRPLTSGGPLPGSEYMEAVPGIPSSDWNTGFLEAEGRPSLTAGVTLEAFRYHLFDQDPGSRWNLSDFDFDRDYKRLGITGSIYDASNPDLQRFRDAGGKLIMYVGAGDSYVPPREVTDYYDKAVAVMGGLANTQRFSRLFVLPGVGHCLGGPGADTVDYLGALEKWVEGGVAPDRLIAYHLKHSVDQDHPSATPTNGSFSRPLFPYPAMSRYKGSGDPNDEKNFVLVNPSPHTRAN